MASRVTLMIVTFLISLIIGLLIYKYFLLLIFFMVSGLISLQIASNPNQWKHFLQLMEASLQLLCLLEVFPVNILPPSITFISSLLLQINGLDVLYFIQFSVKGAYCDL